MHSKCPIFDNAMNAQTFSMPGQLTGGNDIFSKLGLNNPFIVDSQEDFESAWDYLPVLNHESELQKRLVFSMMDYEDRMKAVGKNPLQEMRTSRAVRKTDLATYASLDLENTVVFQEAKDALGDEADILKSMPLESRKDWAVGAATEAYYGTDTMMNRSLLAERLKAKDTGTDSIFETLRTIGDKRRNEFLRVKNEISKARQAAVGYVLGQSGRDDNIGGEPVFDSAESLQEWERIRWSAYHARDWSAKWTKEFMQQKYGGSLSQNELVKSLAALRIDDQEAYYLVMDAFTSEMKGEQDNNIPFLSAGAGELLRTIRGLRSIALGIATKSLTPEESQVLIDLRSVADLSWQAPEGSGIARDIADGTGTAIAQTLAFMATKGGSVIVGGEEKFRQKRAEGNSVYQSFIAGTSNAVANYAAERVTLGSFGQLRRFGIRTPLGKMNGAVDNWVNKGGLFKRYAKGTAVNTLGEIGENFATPLVEYGLDNSLSYMLGAGKLMKWEEAMDEFHAAADWKTNVETFLVSALMGGVTAGYGKIDRVREIRDAVREMGTVQRNGILKVCESPDLLRELGATEQEIARISNTANPDKQIGRFLDMKAAWNLRQQTQTDGEKQVSNNDADKTATSEESQSNQTEELSETDVVAVPIDFPSVRDLMKAGEIDLFERGDDGLWIVTRRDTGEKLSMDENQATHYMNAQLTAAQRQNIFVEENRAAARGAIEYLQHKDPGLVFEKMNGIQTLSRLEAQARIAGDAIAKLNLEGVSNAESLVDPSLSNYMPLGAIRDLPGKFRERIRTENEMAGREVITEQNAVKNADNLVLDDARALIRWVEERASMNEILEEGMEIFAKRDFARRGGTQWHIDNLRALQMTEYYKKLDLGELVPAEGNVEESRVVEALSRVGKSVMTNRIDETKLPEQSRRFINWLKRVWAAIRNLARLGAAVDSAAKSGKIEGDWHRFVYEMAGVSSESYRMEGNKAAADMIRESSRHAVGFSVSETIKSLEGDPNKKNVFDFVDRIFESKEKDKTKLGAISYREVSPREIEDIKSGLGIDASGMMHEFRAEAIAHAINRHGNDSSLNRGQLDLTKEDIKLILDVIDNYDAMHFKKGDGNSSSVIYVKQYPHGEIHTVENVIKTTMRRSKKPRLSFKTAWVRSTIGSTPNTMEVYTPRTSKKIKNENDSNVNGKPGVDFSVASRESFDDFMRKLDNSGHAAKAKFWDATAKRARKEIDRVNELLKTSKAKRVDFLKAVIRSSAVINTAANMLPRGYKFGIDPYVAWMTKYAEAATTGKMRLDDVPDFISEPMAKRIDELEAAHGVESWAEEKADVLFRRFLDRVDEKIEEYAADKYRESLRRIADGNLSVVNKKTGKYGVSRKMGAEDQAILMRIKKYMDLDGSQMQGAIADLMEQQNNIAADSRLGASDRNRQMDEIDMEILRLKTFGNIEEASIDELSTAVDMLLDFVSSGKERWKKVLDDRKERIDKIADEIITESTIKAESGNTLTKQKVAEWEDGEGKLHAGGAPVPMGKMLAAALNGPQLFEVLKTIPGVSRFANEFSRELGSVSTQVDTRMHEIRDRLVKATKKITGKKGREFYRWQNDALKVRDTGIWIKPAEAHKKSISIDDAKKFVETDFSGSDFVPAERAAIRDALEKYNGRSREEIDRDRHKKLQYEYVTYGERQKYVASKMSALNDLLGLRQRRYRFNYALAGFSDDVVAKIEKFCGKEVLELGEYMRREMDWNRDKGIAPVYEKMFGVPFASEENYWPGQFDVAETLKSDKDDKPAGGTPSGMFGGFNRFLMSRIRHNAKPDLTMSASEVYLRHMTETNTWICTAEILNNAKTLLRRKEVSDAIKLNAGESFYSALIDRIKMLENAGMKDSGRLKSDFAMMRACMGPQALGLLSGNVNTVIRQLEAIANGAVAPGVSPVAWIGSMGRVLTGRSNKTIARLWKSNIFKRRVNGARDGRFDIKMATEAMSTPSGMHYPELLRQVQMGMVPMEYVDAGANVLSFSAVYDSKVLEYKKMLEEENKSAPEKERLSEREIEDQANEAARNDVEYGLAVSAAPIDPWTRSLLSGTWSQVFTFMGNDAIKSAARSIMYLEEGRMLMRQGKKIDAWKQMGRAGASWFISGLLNQMIAFAIDWFNDDEPGMPEWKDYMLGILLGPANALPFLGGISEALNWAAGVEQRFGGTGNALFNPVGAMRALNKIWKMANDDKEDSWIDYAKAGANVVKSGGIAGAAASKTMIGATKLGGTIYAAGLTGSTFANLSKFTVGLLDNLGIQDDAKDRKELEALIRKEMKKAKEE